MFIHFKVRRTMLQIHPYQPKSDEFKANLINIVT